MAFGLQIIVHDIMKGIMFPYNLSRIIVIRMIFAKYPANVIKSHTLADKSNLYFLDRTKNAKSHSFGVKEIFVWT